jgi:4'-phosphopantetheinyl transferase
MHPTFTRAPDDTPPLADGEVHLWLLVLDGNPTPREVTAAAQSALIARLMRYSNTHHPPEILRGEHGKPHAPSLAGLDFNLSHARNHVLLAFARNQPLGVDLERIDRRLALEDLARRFFAPAEADALDRLSDDERLPAFLRLWTCKEAVLKAIGAGLSFGLERVVFELGADGIPSGVTGLAPEAGAPPEWSVSLLEPAPGFVGAAAWRGPPRTIRAFLANTDA